MFGWFSRSRYRVGKSYLVDIIINRSKLNVDEMT